MALTSISHGCVYVVDVADGVVQRIETGGGPNGLAVGRDGTIYVAQNGGVFGASGKAEPGVQVIRDGRVDCLATGMGAPNDLAFGPDGRLWVTDSRCEIDFFNPDESVREWVWAIDIDSGATEVMLDPGPVFINGLGFSPGGQRLMVTSTSSAQLLAYPVGLAGAGGRHDADVLCTFEAGWPDGMAVGPDGNTSVALTGGDRLDLVGERGDHQPRHGCSEWGVPRRRAQDAVAGIPADYASAIIDNTLSLLATITTTDDLLGRGCSRDRHPARNPRLSRNQAC